MRWRLEKTRGTACFSEYSVKEGNGPSIHGVSPLAISKFHGEESLPVGPAANSTDVSGAPVPSQAMSRVPRRQAVGDSTQGPLRHGSPGQA